VLAGLPQLALGVLEDAAGIVAGGLRVGLGRLRLGQGGAQPRQVLDGPAGGLPELSGLRLGLVMQPAQRFGGVLEIVDAENPAQVGLQVERARGVIGDRVARQQGGHAEELAGRSERLGHQPADAIGVNIGAVERGRRGLGPLLELASDGQHAPIGQFQVGLDARDGGADPAGRPSVDVGQPAVQAPGGRLHERGLADAVLGDHERQAVGEIEGEVLERPPALDVQSSDHAAARVIFVISSSRSRPRPWAEIRDTRSAKRCSCPTRVR
jgi:hypothetical protein